MRMPSLMRRRLKAEKTEDWHPPRCIPAGGSFRHHRLSFSWGRLNAQARLGMEAFGSSCRSFAERC